MSDQTPAERQPEATTQLSIGPVTAPAPPPSRDAGAGSPGSQRLGGFVAAAVPLALAAPALALPFLWPFVAAALAFCVAVRQRVRDRGESVSAACLSTVEAAARGLLTAMAVLAASVIVALLVSAGLAALWWLAGEGSDGALVAARVGVFEWAWPIASALVCWALLRGPRVEDRWGVVRGMAKSEEDGVLAAVLAGLVVVVLLFALVLSGPRWWPANSVHGVLSALPDGLEDAILDGEASLVENEAVAVVDCLAQHGRTRWAVRSVSRGEDGALRVAIGRLSGGGAGTPAATSALVLALDNQMPRSVVIRVRADPGTPALVVDRREVGGERPATTTAPLAEEAGVPASELPTTPRAVELGLQCGAAAV